jgi:hypothetical protein
VLRRERGKMITEDEGRKKGIKENEGGKESKKKGRNPGI